MKILFPILLLLMFCSCLLHPSNGPAVQGGPFIDSVGYAAAQARLNAIDDTGSDALISQALAVPADSVQQVSQSTFFQSIEESYQRYLKLFTPEKKASRPEIACPYDLIETFQLAIFDPQPFINAMLHTMSLSDLSTLDFDAQPKNADTTLIHVAVTKATSQEQTRWLTFSESELTLAVSRHGAVLIYQKHE